MKLIPIEIIKNWPPNGDENWPPLLVDGALDLDDISLVEDIGDAPNLSEPVVLIFLKSRVGIRCLGSTKDILTWDSVLS